MTTILPDPPPLTAFVVSPHPWVRSHLEDPALLDGLAGPARVCWMAREIHTLLANESNATPLPESPAYFWQAATELESPETSWSDGGYVGEMLYLSVREFLGYATNHLAAASALLREGEYLFSLAPVLRSSVECSARVCWLLDADPACTPRRRSARVMLDRLVSFERNVSSTPRANLGPRTARRELGDRVGVYFTEDEVNNSNGWDAKSTLAGERLPSIESMVANVGARHDQRKEYGRIYAGLSLFSHPNITTLESLSNSDGYFVDVGGLRLVCWLAHLLYLEAMHHAVTFYAWPDEALTEWETYIRSVFPAESSGSSGQATE